jgi:hypothetical protein
MLNGMQDAAVQQTQQGMQQGPMYGPQQGMQQGPMYGPQQGPQQGPMYDPQQGPQQGPMYDPQQGPMYDPQQGPMYDPQQGPMYGPQQGPQQGPMYGPPPGRRQRGFFNAGFDPDFGPDEDLGSAAVGMAAAMISRAIGKRVRRSFEQRIGPALDARLAQAMAQQQQSRLDQAEIVARYPELRGCLRDEVVFLADQGQVVPISEIPMPITLAGADALVNRLRAT